MFGLFDGVVKKAIEDPKKVYKRPEDVLGDWRLGKSQKERVLKSWEEDVKALMRAEDESMSKLDKKRPPDHILQDIHTAQEKLHAS